jgi:hypothetical protein
MTAPPPSIDAVKGESSDLALARVLCLAVAAGASVAAFGFITKASWMTPVWPWPEVGMSFTWIGSITLAIVAPLLCIAITREFAALAGLGINFFVVGAATAAYMGWRIWRWNDAIAVPMVESLLFALIGAGVFLWSRRLKVRDARPMPAFVRAVFVVFVIVLVTTGSAVVLQTERVFPWNLQAPTSTIFGIVFFGAAALFVHAIANPRWAYAAAPLWSFLAYDLVLFVPYGRMLSGSAADANAIMDDYGGGNATVNLPSLTAFLVVLSASCLIALYALFINPATRVLRPRAAAMAAD